MISIAITTSSGENRRFSFDLTEGAEIRIGRDERCDIALPNETYLSRVHCIISYSNGQIVIQDNQSSNGVYLDGERIISDFLKMNEEYKLGDCRMIAAEDDDSAAGAAQAQYIASPTQGFSTAYPQAQEYPQPAAYPQPQAYPQAYPQQQQPQAYPQAYPQQPQAYPQPTAYPQAYPQQQPQAYPQAYPQQAQPYPQPTAYPQAYPQQQPQAYPQAYPQQAQPYPQPTAYPQAQAYPQPQAYPQEYPAAAAAPEPQAYPQPESYPQEYPAAAAVPEPQAYPQPESYPQEYPAAEPEPQAYPQPESYPQEYPTATTEPQAYLQPESYPQEYPAAATEPEPQAEEELPQQPTYFNLGGAPIEPAEAESDAQPLPTQEEPPAAAEPLPPEPEALPTAEPMDAPPPVAAEAAAPAPTPGTPSTPDAEKEEEKPAAAPAAKKKTAPPAKSIKLTPPNPGVKVRKAHNKKKKAEANKEPEPEVQVVSTPGNLMGMPYDFDLVARVTAPGKRLEEGAALRFTITTAEDCRVFLISHNSDGNSELLLPTPNAKDNLVFASVEGKFPNPGSQQQYSFNVEPPFGREVISVIAFGSTQKCDFHREVLDALKQGGQKKVGEFEADAIAHFMEKRQKLQGARWSSALLHLYTWPKEQQPQQPQQQA